VEFNLFNHILQQKSGLLDRRGGYGWWIVKDYIIMYLYGRIALKCQRTAHHQYYNIILFTLACDGLFEIHDNIL